MRIVCAFPFTAETACTTHRGTSLSIPQPASCSSTTKTREPSPHCGSGHPLRPRRSLQRNRRNETMVGLSYRKLDPTPLADHRPYHPPRLLVLAPPPALAPHPKMRGQVRSIGKHYRDMYRNRSRGGGNPCILATNRRPPDCKAISTRAPATRRKEMKRAVTYPTRRSP